MFCPKCGMEMAANAKICKSCGYSNNNNKKRLPVIWIVVLIIVLIIAALIMFTLYIGYTTVDDSTRCKLPPYAYKTLQLE